ncbi:hypothetical protein EDB86DRAFT_2832682 [Lactarius hatsudake]|nr:hypothetical protein EDB86DRAFT_2832682 [Lactarius hatsudake]
MSSLSSCSANSSAVALVACSGSRSSWRNRSPLCVGVAPTSPSTSNCPAGWKQMPDLCVQAWNITRWVIGSRPWETGPEPRCEGKYELKYTPGVGVVWDSVHVVVAIGGLGPGISNGMILARVWEKPSMVVVAVQGAPISSNHRACVNTPRLSILQPQSGVNNIAIEPTTEASITHARSSSSRFQLIFNAALKSYQKQTKNDLIAHPLASQLQSCHSTSDILAVLQHQVQEFDQAHSGDERLTKWLIPTVNVLYAFSAAVSEGVALAAKDVAASKDTLAELFERIGFFFNRLESYTEVTPTAAMTNLITKIMVEVLTIFGIATKELRRGSAIPEEIGRND